MTAILHQFVRDQIAAQGLTVKEFARRAGLGLSHAYQILRGERPKSSAETMDAVARGLSMTPAEMAVAMGKGTSMVSPDELEVLTAYRRVPPEKKPAAVDMLHGLAVQPVNKGERIGRREGATIRRSAGRRVLDVHAATTDDSADQGGLSTVCHALKNLYALSLNFVRGPVEGTVARQPRMVALPSPV